MTEFFIRIEAGFESLADKSTFSVPARYWPAESAPECVRNGKEYRRALVVDKDATISETTDGAYVRDLQKKIQSRDLRIKELEERLSYHIKTIGLMNSVMQRVQGTSNGSVFLEIQI
jgi:hypothetical protein